VLLKREALDRDNNYGLAKQVLEAWKNRRLSQLSQVYVTLPLQRLAQELLVEDASAATSFLLKSTSTGSSSSSSCKINPDTGIVKFEDDSSDGASLDAKKRILNEKLGNAILETTVFSNKMRELQKTAITSHQYILKNTSGASGGGGITGGRSSWMGSSMAGAMDVEYY
jgi:COP9 signalosome complex subunit 3